MQPASSTLLLTEDVVRSGVEVSRTMTPSTRDWPDDEQVFRRSQLSVKLWPSASKRHSLTSDVEEINDRSGPTGSAELPGPTKRAPKEKLELYHGMSNKVCVCGGI